MSEREDLEYAREALSTARWLVGTLSMAGHLATNPGLPEQMDSAIAKLDVLLSQGGAEDEWRPIGDIPVTGDIGHHCMVYGPQVGIKFAAVYRYVDGDIRAVMPGFYGDWQVTHYRPIPASPSKAESSQ